MPITTKCPCGAPLTAPDRLIGRTTICPQCKQWIVVRQGACLKAQRPAEYAPPPPDDETPTADAQASAADGAESPPKPWYAPQGKGEAMPCHPGIAAAMSFVVPGLGLIYRGRLLAGYLWCIVTTIVCVLATEKAVECITRDAPLGLGVLTLGLLWFALHLGGVLHAFYASATVRK